MRIEAATSADMREGADILNAWIDETPWMPRVHSHNDVRTHFSTVVLNERACFVAKSKDSVCGMMALAKDQHLVTALYVGAKSRGMGIGSAFVEKAKSELQPFVELWTFQTNLLARHFYAKHGFVEVRRTNGDNEECLPDVLLRWDEKK
jgi:GNAT superfamily N-acetyltransferase